MYSGTTIRVKSGRVIGVHQRIDKLARRAITARIPAGMPFPTIREILHFEGLNGPDGIKRKSPSVDEPWHHINPSDPNDTQLIDLIEDHIANMTMALQKKDITRAAYEAAWMAHAITDGLTPAHHDDLAGKIEELWGKAHHERDSVRDKTLIRGVNRRDTLKKNWKYWGGKGIFTAHVMFEWGVATSISPLRFDGIASDDTRYEALRHNGFRTEFLSALQRVVDLKMYEEFGRTGWTHKLAKVTQKQLIPEIVTMVALGWYQAIIDAEKKA